MLVRGVDKMQTSNAIEKIRAELELARARINQQQPDLALESLRRLKDQIESFPDTPELAEYSLLIGEAYTAKHSPAAETFLRDAQEKIGRLPERAPDLEYRVEEHLGYFYQEVRKRKTLAKTRYERAKSAAVMMCNRERVARMELRIIYIDLETDTDPELENFRCFRRVAREHNFLCEDQSAAWHIHWGETQETPSSLHARGLQKRSDQYFLDLLTSVRVPQ